MTKYTRFNDIPQFVQDGNYEVDVGPDSLIKTIYEMVDGKSGQGQKLQLDPDFQRGHVWNENQQIAFLEFFLRGGKTARVIYLNNPSWNCKAKTEYDDFVLVDGRQRLEAWRRFMIGEIKVFGSYRNEYTDNLRIMKTMKININSLQTKAEVLQWYIDFNSGGVVHSDEEIARVRKLLKAEQKKKKTDVV